MPRKRLLFPMAAGLHSLRAWLGGCALSGLHSLRAWLGGCALSGLHSLRAWLGGCALSGLHSLRSSRKKRAFGARDRLKPAPDAARRSAPGTRRSVARGIRAFSLSV